MLLALAHCYRDPPILNERVHSVAMFLPALHRPSIPDSGALALLLRRVHSRQDELGTNHRVPATRAIVTVSLETQRALALVLKRILKVKRGGIAQ